MQPQLIQVDAFWQLAQLLANWHCHFKLHCNSKN